MVSPSRLELSGGEADIRLCAFGGHDGGLIHYFLLKHCPFKGHLSGTLQLQSLVGVCCGGGMFWLRMVLLCPSMICFMFGEQL